MVRLYTLGNSDGADNDRVVDGAGALPAFVDEALAACRPRLYWFMRQARTGSVMVLILLGRRKKGREVVNLRSEPRKFTHQVSAALGLVAGGV
jgi:hypothetical protein